MTFIRSIAGAAAFLLLLVRLSPAQANADSPVIRSSLHSGAIEIGFSAGGALGNVGGALVNLPGTITFGVSGSGGGAGRITGAVAVTGHFLTVAEVSYLNGTRETHDLGGGTIAETATRAMLFSAAGQYRFFRSVPPRGRFQFVPYAGLGVGTIQNRADVLVTASVPPATAGADIIAAATRVKLREPAFAPMVMAGLRVFTRHYYGFRVEGRGILPTGSSHDPVGDVVAGVFFVLH